MSEGMRWMVKVVMKALERAGDARAKCAVNHGRRSRGQGRHVPQNLE